MGSALHVCAGMSQDGSSLTESWAGPGNDGSSSVASRSEEGGRDHVIATTN